MATTRKTRGSSTAAHSARTTSTRSGRSKSGSSTARAIAPAIMTTALIAGSVVPVAKAPAPTAPSGAAGPAIVQKGSFTPVCTLPFNGARNPAIDDHCGIEGDGTDTADQLEATAKNNFCATPSNPDDLTYDKLKELQTQSAGVPKSLGDRKQVQNLGEGNYVSYVALIVNAHYSDVSAGEKVNCNLKGNPPNDIHIPLMSDPNDKDECNSTTAEMSPHYRPAGWTPAVLNGLKKPVRIRGQLFYDNSHTPCTASSRPNPKRISLWEIHPVYEIVVCKSTDLNQCRKAIDDDSQWDPIT